MEWNNKMPSSQQATIYLIINTWQILFHSNGAPVRPNLDSFPDYEGDRYCTLTFKSVESATIAKRVSEHVSKVSSAPCSILHTFVWMPYRHWANLVCEHALQLLNYLLEDPIAHTFCLSHTRILYIIKEHNCIKKYMFRANFMCIVFNYFLLLLICMRIKKGSYRILVSLIQ